jgi:hypothetical protein
VNRLAGVQVSQGARHQRRVHACKERAHAKAVAALLTQGLRASLLLLLAAAGCAQSFLQLLCMLDARVRVQLCCVGAANTAADGSPACCQLALDTQTWTPQPWLFRDRGPEVPRRFVAQHCRCVV